MFIMLYYAYYMPGGLGCSVHQAVRRMGTVSEETPREGFTGY